MDEQPGSATLVDDLLGRPAAQYAVWIAAHRPQLSIALIEELKRQTDQSLRSDSELANKASACALVLAESMPEQPLAAALANWARGNWASFNAPSDAIICYRQALKEYRNANNPLAVARLLANLVASLAECGHFAESDD